MANKGARRHARTPTTSHHVAQSHWLWELWWWWSSRAIINNIHHVWWTARSDSTPPQSTRPFPLEKLPWNSSNDFTGRHGYSLTTRTSKKRKSDDILYQVCLHCNRGGKYQSRIDKNNRVQKEKTKLMGCPFQLVLRSLQQGWIIQSESLWHIQ